ncbi:hypothetical protein BDI4_190006 [Burkholderia diffusa]|nr:hypothetical protein BDI4_190006 [Burkholderia diffusa]
MYQTTTVARSHALRQLTRWGSRWASLGSRFATWNATQALSHSPRISNCIRTSVIARWPSSGSRARPAHSQHRRVVSVRRRHRDNLPDYGQQIRAREPQWVGIPTCVGSGSTYTRASLSLETELVCERGDFAASKLPAHHSQFLGAGIGEYGFRPIPIERSRPCFSNVS